MNLTVSVDEGSRHDDSFEFSAPPWKAIPLSLCAYLSTTDQVVLRDCVGLVGSARALSLINLSTHTLTLAQGPHANSGKKML